MPASVTGLAVGGYFYGEAPEWDLMRAIMVVSGSDRLLRRRPGMGPDASTEYFRRGDVALLSTERPRNGT